MQYLEDALADHEHQAVLALEAESFGAAVKAKMEARRVRQEIDTLRAEEAAVASIPVDQADHQAQLLIEVRRLRAAASEAGSYVAAQALLRLEAEMSRQLGPTAPSEDLPPHVMVTQLAQLLADLPDDLRRQVIGSIDDLG
jgi:hypothetical protein